jgi:hypothetical protein
MDDEPLPDQGEGADAKRQQFVSMLRRIKCFGGVHFSTE